MKAESVTVLRKNPQFLGEFYCKDSSLELLRYTLTTLQSMINRNREIKTGMDEEHKLTRLEVLFMCNREE